MSKSLPPYHSIKALPRFGNNLSAYVAKAQLLESLTEKIRSFLTESFRPHCRVANMRGKTLVLQITNQALVTRLQYELPPLKEKIRALGLDINDIRLTVKPDENPKPTQHHLAIRPGPSAGKSLRASLKYIEDPQLQAAIQSLADNFDDKT